jgi:hypothetical protein
VTWLVPWNGKEYDVDPLEFTQLEMSAIKERTKLSFNALMNGACNLDGDAIRALFWTVDRRENPDLKFSDYPGPPLKVVIPHIEILGEVAAAVLKAMRAANEKGGSVLSPSGTDTPPASSTD